MRDLKDKARLFLLLESLLLLAFSISPARVTNVMAHQLAISDGLRAHPLFPTYNLPLVIPTPIDAVTASNLYSFCADIRLLSGSSLELRSEANVLNELVYRWHGELTLSPILTPAAPGVGDGRNHPPVNNDDRHNELVEGLAALRADMIAERAAERAARAAERAADRAERAAERAIDRREIAAIRGDTAVIRGDLTALAATIDRHHMKANARAALGHAIVS